MNKESIVLGGGCFWCTEAVFEMLKGVISVEPGYSGGQTQNPTYDEVCGGATGHAEVIKIDYDPKLVSLENLLTVFFATHDPTSKNKQGDDIGEQYRSIILYSNDKQKEISEKFIKELNNSSQMGIPIAIEVKMLKNFYPAEDHHKNYYQKNKTQPYCEVVINPKLKKVQEKFKELLK